MTYLFAVMRRKHRKRRHGIDRQRLGHGRRERLRKERDTPLRFAPAREELALEALVALRDEERGSAQRAMAVLLNMDPMIEELLHVLDREKVLAVHGDDDGVPDLGDKDLNSSQDSFFDAT